MPISRLAGSRGGLGARAAFRSIYKHLYTAGRGGFQTRPVSGSSLEDLRAFPLTARREAGHQLDEVQHGREPDDSKPLNTEGQGVKEIRIRDEAGAFRILYVAMFADAIYVLHCFQKNTRKTSKADVELAARRYRELLKERRQ